MDPKDHETAAFNPALDHGAPRRSMSLPCTGDRIGDKYVITNHLGEGGMGIVFEALHVRLRQPVALKFLKPAALAFPESVTRFEREARATGQLRGPHVAHVLDVDVDSQGLPYIVMELLSGRDLDAEMQLRPGPFPVSEAVHYVVQACAGMAEAHALGIVHRDLKPSNLFLAENDEGTRTLKILDFGISKMMQVPSNVTSTCVSMGTPLYMSPEQVRSSKYVDQRTDVWSLGVMLYELLAGVPPFTGTATACIAAIIADDVPPLSALRADLPAGLEAAVAKALQKDADLRYCDVHAFAEALAPFAVGPTPTFTKVVSRPSYSAVPDEAQPLMSLRPVTHPRPLPAPVTTTAKIFGQIPRKKIRKLPNARMFLAAGVALLCIPVLMLGSRSANATRAVESPSRALGESASLAMLTKVDLAPATVPAEVAAPLVDRSIESTRKVATPAASSADKRTRNGNPLHL
jgi:serine/threonine protein kinase